MNLSSKSDWSYSNVKYKNAKYPPSLIKRILPYFPKDGIKEYLEIGCEPGFITNYIAFERDYRFSGINYVGTNYFELELSKIYPTKYFKKYTFDIFNDQIDSDKKYEIVTSYGFVEHFSDLREVISIHKNYLLDNGLLIYTMPNFRGVFGLFHKYFAPKSYSIHNIASMDIEKNLDVLKSLDFKIVDAGYCGGWDFWGFEKGSFSYFKFPAYVFVRIISRYFLSFNFSKIFPQSYIYFIATSKNEN